MGEETRDCVKCPAFDGEDESQVLMSQLKQESNPNQFPNPLHLHVDDLVAFDPCQFPTPPCHHVWVSPNFHMSFCELKAQTFCGATDH